MDEDSTAGYAWAATSLDEVMGQFDPSRPYVWRLALGLRQLMEVDGVALTLGYNTSGQTLLGATDEASEAVENLQEIFGEGPAYDAVLSQRVVVGDFSDENSQKRWPLLHQAVAEQHGQLVLYGVPMLSAEQVIGIATAYTQDREATTIGVGPMQRLVDAATNALLAGAPEAMQGYEIDPGALATRDPWRARAVIHQATGMVMAQMRTSAADAVALLQAHAYAQTEKNVHEVARRVVRREINFADLDAEGD